MKVYIAGPYTKGDPAVNVRNAIEAGEKIRALGHTPFIPHLTHFWHLIFPHDLEFWYSYDNEWLTSCDCLLRIGGESIGADNEAQLMRETGKPVYYTIEELERAN